MGNIQLCTSGVMQHKLSGSIAVDKRHVCTVGSMLHKVSGLVRAVVMGKGNRHVCASGVILYEVSVSVHAVDMSNGHMHSRSYATRGILVAICGRPGQ